MTLRRGKDYPVAVRDLFVKRAQDFSVGKTRNLQAYHEMGNTSPVGTDADVPDFNASVSWFPIDNTFEEELADKAAAAGVNLAEIIAAAPMLVESKWDGIEGARLSSLEYSVQVDGEFQGTAQFQGINFTDGRPALTADAITGAGVYKAKSVNLVLNGARSIRVQGVKLSITIPTEKNSQLGDDLPFEVTQDQPTITLDVDYFEDTVATGVVRPEITDSMDAVIGVGGIAKLITVKNIVWTEESAKAQTKGAGTRRYRYISKGDSTTGGVSFGTGTAPTCTLAVDQPTRTVGQVAVLTATAADATGGVSKVRFYKGSIYLGEDTSNPYTFSWTAEQAGTFTFTAVAEDIYGAKTSSSGVTVTVT